MLVVVSLNITLANRSAGAQDYVAGAPWPGRMLVVSSLLVLRRLPVLAAGHDLHRAPAASGTRDPRTGDFASQPQSSCPNMPSHRICPKPRALLGRSNGLNAAIRSAEESALWSAVLFLRSGSLQGHQRFPGGPRLAMKVALAKSLHA